MGLRHLRGLAEVSGEIHIVDLKKEAEERVREVADKHGLKAEIYFYPGLELIPEKVKLDAAILSGTANGRLERVKSLAARGIKNLLLEKPAEQSRERFRQLLELAEKQGLNIRCNHHFRSRPFYRKIYEQGGPFLINISGGAFGLGCNGIHWLDLAVFLTGSKQGKMLFGEIDPDSFTGPREGFEDFGGRGVFSFADGSRLILDSWCRSSVPTIVSIRQLTRHYIIDNRNGIAVIYEGKTGSTDPAFLRGKDYIRNENDDLKKNQLWDLTADWVKSLTGDAVCHSPAIQEASLSNELLFDLLETSGRKEFNIT